MVKKLLLKVAIFWLFTLGTVAGYGQCPTSVSISASPGNTICEGTTVTFTATPNGGTNLSFEWLINDAPVDNGTSFSRSTLNNGDKVKVIVTSSDDTTCSTVSSTITMTVNSNKIPTVSLSSSPSLKCVGESVSFTATNTNGGTSPQYAWYVNSDTSPSQTSGSNTFSTSSLPAGANSVRVVLTSNLTCVTTSTAEATANITITDNASIGTPGNKDQSDLCLNSAIDPITFSVEGSGNGATVSGLPPGVSGSYSSGNLTISGEPTSSGSFTYTVTATGPCGSATESGTLTVLKDATINLSSGNNSQDVCQDEAIANITYDIGETGTGASVTGLPSGISGNFSDGVYTISGSSSQVGSFPYTITATGTCGNSESINGTITISENLIPSVSISSSDADNTICAGTDVTFTAAPVNGGSNPSYQWQIDGSNAGSDSPTFTTNSLADGQLVTVIMTSDATCLTQPTATSNEIVTTVNPNLTPEVSVSVSDSDICDGDEVTFTASPVNGGSTPSYQWKLDGNNVGTNSPTYVTSNLTDGQSVTVVLTSNETCVATTTATSDPVSVTVNPNLTPEVSITSNDPNNIICAGDSITFTATSVNEGATPSYQWYVDSNPAGSGGASFTTSSLTNGQTVKVVLTSDEECLAVSTAESNGISIQVDSSVTGITPAFDTSDPTINSTAVCPVVSGLKYRVQNIPGATSYSWTFPSGWNITSGAGTREVTVTATASAQPGNIRVVASSECGLSNEFVSEYVSTGTVVYVNAGPDQTVCKGTTQITLAGEIGGVITKHQDWDWSASVSGGSFSNGGNSLDGTYIIPSSIANSGGTIIIKITSIDPAGPCDPKEDQMIITVLKNATISNPSNKDQRVCINNPINNIVFTITDAGTGATVSGLPAGLTGNYNSGIFTISGTPTQAGTFNYTINSTGSCANQQTAISGTIIVTPNQTIDDPANKSQEICINTPIENILFSTNAPVTNVSATGLPAGLSGSYSSGSFTIRGTATEAGSFDYIVTTTGNCVNTTQNGNITVKPDPTIDTPVNKDQELCINTTLADIQFNISSPATDAEVTGLPDGLSGSFNNGVFTISGSPGVAGTFDYTVTTLSDCSDVSESGQIVVKPDPTAEIQYLNDLCESQSGDVTATLTGTGAFEGGNYYSTPAGLSLDAVTGEITPGASTPGTYTVFYDTPGGCKTATASTTVIINELPSVDINYTGPFCNSDATEYSVSFSNGIGAYAGGTFSSDSGGLDIDPDTGSINPLTSSPRTTPYTVFYTIPATLGCEPVTVQTEVTITQLPQVTISYTTPLCTADPNSYTVNYSSFAGDYLGGAFTATEGLVIDSQGTIDPGNSTPGIHTITYTKDNDADGCEAIQVTTQVEIFEKVQITTQPVNFGTCSSNPASFEVVATGDNLTYQWFKKDSGGTFVQINGETNPILSFSNATSANEGEYHVVVSSSNAVCTSETSDPVTLNIDEDIIITKPVEDITICEDDYETLSFDYEAHANGAELSFQWIKDGNPINETTDKYVMTKSGPTGTDGVYTGTLTILNIGLSDDGVYAVEIDGPEYFTCSEATSKTFTFRVNPRPDAPVTTAVDYCLNATASALTATKASDDNELLWYSYDADTDKYTYLGTSITPSTSTAGTTSYWVSQKQPNSCESDKAEVVVTVFDKPEPIATETIQFSYCFNETVTDPVSISPTEGSTINWYDAVDATKARSSAPIPNTSVAKLTSYWVSQTLTSTGCESDRTKVDIIINELPNVTIKVAEGYSAEICKASETRLVAAGATSYIWYFGENVIGDTSEVTIVGESAGIFEYRVVGTDDNGCVNENVVSIKVEEPSDGGTATGPSSVCVTNNQGSITVADYTGEIQRWESSTDGTNWTTIANTTETLNFQDIPGTTLFRAIVKNGVCEETASNSISVAVDSEPVAGQILFKGTDRVFMMCEFPTADYLVPLKAMSGFTGEIVAWQFRRSSQSEWQTVMNSDGTNFTGNELSGQQVNEVANNESTLFRVEVQSGACQPNVYSDYATLSIIPSDIAPNPVTITRPEICLGESIELSSGTGYGGYGTFIGGAFDNSSIANHGWRVMRFDDQTEYTFESAADNVRPNRWLRTNPKEFEMANINGSGVVDQLFDSSSGDEGNKGFAIVSGDNPSTLETPVFNTFAMDDPTLTFDQAYNLTAGDTIKVQISLDGGNTYLDEPLFVVGGPVYSGNYHKFGDDDLGEPNNMVIDLSQYAGLPNLRIRWLYDGSTGGIYTIDDIGIPQDPDNVELIWYYDDDPNDPNNPLDQIGEVNQSTVTYTPTKIGWNYFQVNTALVFDTNGDPCQSAENMATIQVYVFDSYTTTATANVGSCGSIEVPLKGVLTGGTQGEITEFPVDDTSTIAWTLISGPDGYTFSESHFTTSGTGPAINDPNAIFTPPIEGNYTLAWTITADERNTCPIQSGTVDFYFGECSTLDFDGVDDYVDLGNSYTGNHMIEAWVRPFDRPLVDSSGNTNASNGTVISGPGFEITMSDLLAAGVQKNTRWYHIAVANNGTIWIDGVSSGSISVNGHGGNKTVIGAKWDPSAKATSNHFSGWIEEVRIWKKDLTQKQIRFMMNQRLKLDASGTVVSPLQGEVVPNLVIQDGGLSSYHTDGTYNLDQDGIPFFNLTTTDLAGYYRLISNNPDPQGLITFDAALMPNNGSTPDHSINKIAGRLYNITTNQENTSPTPYLSGAAGVWTEINTWARPDVWDYPNSSFDGEQLNWNIARTSHDITSGSKDITMLGLLSDSNLLTINADHPLRITHYLLLNGNIDLVGESQLLQDHGSILDNASAGWLQRDQQGKRLSYNYNYWSSPVNNQGANNNSGYTVGGILRDGTDPTQPQDITFKDGYYVADGSRTSPITISNYWIWKFHGTADTYGEWYYTGSTGSLLSGEGYTMKGTDGTVGLNDPQNYVFQGKPHNGNIPGLTIGTGQNHLIGNPYPSAIDAKEFLRDNLSLSDVNGGKNTKNVFNGALYFWDHFDGFTHILKEYVGGYATLNLTTSVEATSVDWRINANDKKSAKKPGQYIPVGQAFFVNTAQDEASSLTNIEGGNIVFKNTQRIFKPETGSGTSLFLSQERKDAPTAVLTQTQSNLEEENSVIWLKFKSPKGYNRQIAVGTDPYATDNFDLGYDAFLIDNNIEDMFWYFENSRFVIQGIKEFTKDKELDLGIKISEKGELTIKLDDLQNFPDDLPIFLKDELLQKIHDLREAPYKTESEPGTFTDRFKIVFQDNTVVEPEPEEPEVGDFKIMYVNGTREIFIMNPHKLEIEKVYLNNMLGQQVHMFYDIPTQNLIKLPVSRFGSGVYVVKVHSEKGITTKKVILE